MDKTRNLRSTSVSGIRSLRVMVTLFAVACLSDPRAMTCAFVPPSAASALVRAKAILNHRGDLATGSTKTSIPGRSASTTALPLRRQWKQFIQKSRLLQGKHHRVVSAAATAISSFDISWIVSEFQDLSHLDEFHRFQRKAQYLGLHHESEIDSEYALLAWEAEQSLLQRAKDSAAQLEHETQQAQQHAGLLSSDANAETVTPRLLATRAVAQTSFEAEIEHLRTKQTVLLHSSTNVGVRLDPYQAATERLQNLASASKEDPSVNRLLFLESNLETAGVVSVEVSAATGIIDAVVPMENDVLTPALAASTLFAATLMATAYATIGPDVLDPTNFQLPLSIGTAEFDPLLQALRLAQQNLLLEAQALFVSFGEVINGASLYMIEIVSRAIAALNVILAQLEQFYFAASSTLERLVAETLVTMTNTKGTFFEACQQAQTTITESSNQVQTLLLDSAKHVQTSLTESFHQAQTVFTESTEQVHTSWTINVKQAQEKLTEYTTQTQTAWTQVQVMGADTSRQAQTAWTDMASQTQSILSQNTMRAQTMAIDSSKQAQVLTIEAMDRVQAALVDSATNAQAMWVKSVDRLEQEILDASSSFEQTIMTISAQVEAMGIATAEEIQSQVSAIRVPTIDTQAFAGDLLERVQQALMLVPFSKAGSSSLNIAILDQVAQAQQSLAAILSQWMVVPVPPTDTFDLDGWKAAMQGLVDQSTTLWLHNAKSVTGAHAAMSDGSLFPTDGNLLS